MLTLNRIFYPVNFWIAVGLLCNGDDIKTCRYLLRSPAFLQITLGAELKLVLFPGINTAGTVDQTVGLAIPDFNKNNGLILFHYQVDLTIAAVKIPFDKRQAMLPEKLAGQIFSKRSFFLGVAQS